MKDIENELNSLDGINLNDVLERRDLNEIISNLRLLLDDAWDYLNETR